VQYLGAWLAGNGCVPVFNLMEDAATAEISRSQIWQWIRSPKGVLDDGRKVTKPLVRQLLAEELLRVRNSSDLKAGVPASTKTRRGCSRKSPPATNTRNS